MILPLFDGFHLRSLEHADAADIYNTIDSEREYLGKWLPFVAKNKSVADAEAFLRTTLDVPADQLELMLSMRTGDDKFIGIIGFTNTDTDNHKTEVGYWLSEHYQKKGIVTAALRAICTHAFNEMDIHRIQIRCAIGNVASRNIPIKMGFSFEGIERDGEWIGENLYHNLEVYGLLKTDKMK